MPDYSEYGYSSRLNSLSSIPERRGSITTPFDFGWGFERDVVQNKHINSLTADKIAAGTVTVALTVGTASGGTITLDGANTRIVLHDGTTNRVVIGNV